MQVHRVRLGSPAIYAPNGTLSWARLGDFSHDAQELWSVFSRGLAYNIDEAVSVDSFPTSDDYTLAA